MYFEPCGEYHSYSEVWRDNSSLDLEAVNDDQMLKPANQVGCLYGEILAVL